MIAPVEKPVTMFKVEEKWLNYLFNELPLLFPLDLIPSNFEFFRGTWQRDTFFFETVNRDLVIRAKGIFQ